jgi:uncharacterized protein YutE (UPF0331/DUF86 family)
MVDPDLVAAKLEALAQRVERVRAHRAADAAELARNADALDLVSFNLMLSVQICADIASHLIADEGWPMAPTVGGSFSRLHEHGVLSAETAEQLKKAVGLRNVVAHGYAAIDPALVHAAATDGVHDLEAFARDVARWARREDSSRSS